MNLLDVEGIKTLIPGIQEDGMMTLRTKPIVDMILCGKYLLDNFENILGNIRCRNAQNLTFELLPQLVVQLCNLK